MSHRTYLKRKYFSTLYEVTPEIARRPDATVDISASEILVVSNRRWAGIIPAVPAPCGDRIVDNSEEFQASSDSISHSGPSSCSVTNLVDYRSANLPVAWKRT